MGPKIDQNQSQGPLGELWRPSWPQDGSKSQHRLQNLVRWTPLDVEVGGQNPPKIGPKLIQNVLIFLLIFWIDFWSDLVPTWSQLGSQNPLKMQPRWLPKAIQQANSQNVQNVHGATARAQFLRVRGSQVGTKIHQKSVQEGVKNKMRF